MRIESIDAARVYFLPPSSVSPPLFLSDENAFIIKTTDDIGMASLKKYRFEEIPIEDEHSSEEFITREYFDRRINEIMYDEVLEPLRKAMRMAGPDEREHMRSQLKSLLEA